jgi:hypothetical protein
MANILVKHDKLITRQLLLLSLDDYCKPKHNLFVPPEHNADTRVAQVAQAWNRESVALVIVDRRQAVRILGEFRGSSSVMVARTPVMVVTGDMEISRQEQRVIEEAGGPGTSIYAYNGFNGANFVKAVDEVLAGTRSAERQSRHYGWSAEMLIHFAAVA